jgi:glyoxylase I family protein
MSEIMGIHHASLLVADTARALAFYRDLLGLAVIAERPDLGFPGAWLRVGSQQIHLLELPSPDPLTARPDHGGRDRHLALFVQDFEALAGRLEAGGDSLQPQPLGPGRPLLPGPGCQCPGVPAGPQLRGGKVRSSLPPFAGKGWG